MDILIFLIIYIVGCILCWGRIQGNNWSEKLRTPNFTFLDISAWCILSWGGLILYTFSYYDDKDKYYFKWKRV